MSLFTSRELTELRALQAAGMGDTCVIQRTVAAAFNDTTGQYAAPGTTDIYAGACRVAPSTAGTPTLVGEEEVVYRQTDIFIPFDAAVPREDDIVVITASGEDPELVDRVFRIVEVRVSGNNASRMLSCTNLQPSDNAPQVT